LQAHLHAAGVQALIHYPIPIHHQEPCKAMLRDSKGLGNSERHAVSCLSLPCHPQMTNDEVSTVITAVNAYSL
jgi:dTDP-4-amino-4,6-dideoxygalactose transaminase